MAAPNVSRRLANRPALEEILVAAFRRHNRDGVAARLEAAGIAYGRLPTLEDVAGHPQNRTVEIDTPTGPGPVPVPVPGLGQDTEAVGNEFMLEA